MKRIPWWILICVPLLVGCLSPDTRDFHGQVTDATPWDRKYERVQKYLEDAGKFTYQREGPGDYWRMPHETEAASGGDCEDQAIWLYAKLLDDGFTDVRLVVGMLFNRDKTPRGWHAWVQWYSVKGVYVLDPTARWAWPTLACNTRRWLYHPMCSFYRGTRYVHEWLPYE